MIRISILGTGNVAWHLYRIFAMSEDIEVIQIIGRNPTAMNLEPEDAQDVSGFSNIADADVFIIAVKDDAITEVSEHLLHKKGLVVHTSGSVAMDALSKHRRRGVFYPLQTFSADRKVDFGSVPLCLEAGDPKDLEVLKKLASTLTNKVYEVNSEQRKALHLAAVFGNNFTNHLFYIAQQLCEKNGLAFEMLHPLLKETVDKIGSIPPRDAQTGPARRGDSKTIERHLKQLENPALKVVYSNLSKSIEKVYN